MLLWTFRPDFVKHSRSKRNTTHQASVVKVQSRSFIYNQWPVRSINHPRFNHKAGLYDNNVHFISS